MGVRTTSQAIKAASGSTLTPRTQDFTPIATDIFIPNHSGISSHTETFNNLGIVPIGVGLPWFKSLTGTPQTLPSNFVECNGQTISDVNSVYNGQVIPNLNGSNYFLRGNSTSGGTGGEAAHTLTIAEMPAHTHDYTTPGSNVFKLAGASESSGLPSVDTVGSTGGGGSHENRPPFYNVVWIVRIK